MTNLKSLLQLPIKADQRGIKDCCEMKGECVRAHVCVREGERVPVGKKLLKGTVHEGEKNKSQQVEVENCRNISYSASK